MELTNKLNKENEDALISIASEAGFIDKKEFRNKITLFANLFKEHPDSYGFGTEVDNINPLEHSFGDGTYIRKITMPAGQLIITKIHKIKHPYFVMSGSITVITEDGVKKINAPYHGITMPGTQRIIYVNEECVFITVHPTKKTNVEEIMKDVTTETFDDPLLKLN